MQSLEENSELTKVSKIIAVIESANNPYALRYEPGWKWSTEENIKLAARAHKCNFTTAETLLAMSYGRYQIMGGVLYELGYRGRLAPDFLNNETVQDIYFAKYLTARKCPQTLTELRTADGRYLFARRYNGSGATDDYSMKIKRAMIALNYLEA